MAGAPGRPALAARRACAARQGVPADDGAFGENNPAMLYRAGVPPAGPEALGP